MNTEARLRAQLETLIDILNLLTEAHSVVGSFSNGEDVGRHLVSPLAAVQANRSHGVDWEPLVRVHGDTEQARVGL